MGPSCRRKTPKSSSSSSSSTRKTLLIKKSSAINIQEKSSVLLASPAKLSEEVVDNIACSTPKSKRYRIPEIKTCPPAPKKRRTVTATSSISSSCSLMRRSAAPVPYFAPPDIELFFYFALRDRGVSKCLRLSNICKRIQ